MRAGITFIAAGGYRSVLLRDDGSVFDAGTVKDDVFVYQRDHFEKLEVGGRILVTAAGSLHSLGLMASGNVVAWGVGTDGRLGQGGEGNGNHEYPVEVAGVEGGMSVGAGDCHSMVVMENGRVMGFGRNSEGQIGPGEESPGGEVRIVEGIEDVVSVGCGSGWSVMLKADGNVVTSGLNDEGQLGSGRAGEGRESFEIVEGIEDVVGVAAGGYHCMAVMRDGRVATWGLGTSGQLGHGVYRSEVRPRVIEGLTECRMVAASPGHSAVVRTDGRVWTSGLGDYGALGHGERGDESAARVVEPLEGERVIGVACGTFHSLFLGEVGSVWGCGRSRPDSALGGDLVGEEVDEAGTGRVLRPSRIGTEIVSACGE